MESQKSSYRLARLSGAQRVSAVAPDSVLSVPLLLLRPTRSDIASVSTGRRSRLGAIVQWERSPPYARPPPRRWGDPQRRRDLLKFYFYGRRAKRGSPESSVHGYRCRTPFRVCTLTEGVMRPRYPGRSRDQRKDCLALYAPFHLFVFTLFLVSLFFRPLLFLSLGLPLSLSLSLLLSSSISLRLSASAGRALLLALGPISCTCITPHHSSRSDHRLQLCQASSSFALLTATFF